MGESMEKNQSIFNIYYLNFSKVYEISMMINNVITASIQRERSVSKESVFKRKSSLSAGAKSEKYLADIKSAISYERSNKDTFSSKMIENLDVKTTKSILLRRIIEKCNEIQDFKSCQEGDLIKLNNIKFKMLDEESLRQMLVLKKEAFKGFMVEGMDVNNIISSMVQDFAYILYGEIEGVDEKIIIKIPADIQGEFESNYNVDDLLIGKLSLIGIYKSDVKESFINNNTFNYMVKLGEGSKEKEKKVFSSNSLINEKLEELDDEDRVFKFLDIIAIIQDVKFNINKEEKEDKVGFIRRLINNIKKWWKN